MHNGDTRRKRTVQWRDYLTPDERAELDKADDAKKRWQKLNRARAGIVNRAINRAKYALGLR